MPLTICVAARFGTVIAPPQAGSVLIRSPAVSNQVTATDLDPETNRTTRRGGFATVKGAF
jgi:hypothetical protein